MLYLGDAANKFVVYEKEKLGQLGVPITNHDKLPDVILYREDKNWLYLIEAVTSHGPVSHKRKFELEKLLQSCTASPIYVTAFQDVREFRRHAADIAWETEVWIAEMPEHMIHYNGDKFVGPHDKTPGLRKAIGLLACLLTSNKGRLEALVSLLTSLFYLYTL